MGDSHTRNTFNRFSMALFGHRSGKTTGVDFNAKKGEHFKCFTAEGAGELCYVWHPEPNATEVETFWSRGDYVIVNYGHWILNDAWRPPNNNASHMKQGLESFLDGLKNFLPGGGPIPRLAYLDTYPHPQARGT